MVLESLHTVSRQGFVASRLGPVALPCENPL